MPRWLKRLIQLLKLRGETLYKAATCSGAILFYLLRSAPLAILQPFVIFGKTLMALAPKR